MLLADFYASKMAFECGRDEKPVFSDEVIVKQRYVRHDVVVMEGVYTQILVLS